VSSREPFLPSSSSLSSHELNLGLYRVPSTFRDMTKREDLVKKLEEIADELTEHLTSLRFAGRTLQFKYKTHEYKREFPLLPLTHLLFDLGDQY